MPTAGFTQDVADLSQNQDFKLRPRFELSAIVKETHGMVKRATWIDDDRFLTLVLSIEGATVYRTSYSTLTRETFISTQFIESYICPANLSTKLEWTLSPQKNFLCFLWFDDDGTREWVLLDIANAPEFKILRFPPPPGMQVSQVLFSPDDRYITFVHDSYKGSCDVTALVMDSQAGSEYWRIGSQQLSFISGLWWGGAIYEAPQFYVTAQLFNGQFLDALGMVHVGLADQTVNLVESSGSVITGAATVWGNATCYQAGSSTANSFFLDVNIPGNPVDSQIPLNAYPISLTLLTEPGLMLLSNTGDQITNQLWMVDALNGRKSQVDDDCEEYSLSLSGKLLVRPKQKIDEIRIYELRSPNGSLWQPIPNAT